MGFSSHIWDAIIDIIVSSWAENLESDKLYGDQTIVGWATQRVELGTTVWNSSLLPIAKPAPNIKTMVHFEFW